jgi:hypothetical protein
VEKENSTDLGNYLDGFFYQFISTSILNIEEQKKLSSKFLSFSLSQLRLSLHSLEYKSHVLFLKTVVSYEVN